MRNLVLMAGAALMAITPALADAQGNGRGGDRGAEARQEGRGQARQARQQQRVERRAPQAQRGEARAQRREARRGNGRDGVRQERRADRSERRQAERRADRRDRRARIRQAERAQRQSPRRVEERRIRREARRPDLDRPQVRPERRDVRSAAFRDLMQSRAQEVRYSRDASPSSAFRNGCPPGLAKQNDYCMPPGQLRRAHLIGDRVPFASWDYNIPERYRYRFDDNDRYYYRYGEDGYVYELNRSSGLVSSVVPLYANDLLIGEPLPLGYEVYNVPLAYRDYYQDDGDYIYRYDDGAIYRANSETGIVDGIVALLTGGTGGLGSLGVGQMLPAGYDVYNVPLDYRDRYYDTDEYMYRYADGNIYQVDPQTQLIQAVISLLA